MLGEAVQSLDHGVFIRCGQAFGITLQISGVRWDYPEVVEHGDYGGGIVACYISEDGTAEIAALDYVSGVVELVHERVESVARFFGSPAGFQGRGGEGEAWDAGSYHVEGGYGGVGWVEKAIEDVVHLHEAAWPAVDEE